MRTTKTLLLLLLVVFGEFRWETYVNGELYICWFMGGKGVKKILVDSKETCSKKSPDLVSMTVEEQFYQEQKKLYPNGGEKTETCVENALLIDPIQWDIIHSENSNVCFDYVREKMVVRYHNGTVIVFNKNGTVGKFVPSIAVLFAAFSLMAMYGFIIIH